MSATIVVDLGFGDAGKGSIVDFLARRTSRPSVAVRFNGGAQAAHNVLTATGLHHTFSQFGSASLVPGGKTFLSRFMLVDPLTMVNEANHLTDIGCGNPYHSLNVDEQAMVVTPYHKLVNRAREIERGADRHGSCGMGIGETMALHERDPGLTLRVSDLSHFETSHRKLRRLQEWAVAAYPDIEPHDPAGIADRMWQIVGRLYVVDGRYLGTLGRTNDLIFEGAQGVLLDETYGFHPYTTWSTTTFKNALTLLSEIGYTEPVARLGVLRAYGVRHGPGPFPTEDAHLTELLQERHNSHGEWQGAFRVGNFDAVLARYAIEVCGGIDSLAITNIDRLSRIRDQVTVCIGYQHDSHTDRFTHRLLPVNEPTLLAQAALGQFVQRCKPVLLSHDEGLGFANYLQHIEQELGVSASIHSYGPTAVDKVVVDP